jgi:hypothetical protein
MIYELRITTVVLLNLMLLKIFKIKRMSLLWQDWREIELMVWARVPVPVPVRVDEDRVPPLTSRNQESTCAPAPAN